MTAGLVVLLCAAMAAPASADRHSPTLPSRSDVASAQQHVAVAQRSVGAIEADLAAASARLNGLAQAAEQASEAYNGALLHWQEAKAAAVTARHRADRAAVDAQRARDRLAGVVVSQEAAGTSVSAFSAAFGAGGPHTLISQVTGDQTSGRVLSSDYQSWHASAQLARVYQAAARKALSDAATAKATAAQAKTAATTAVSAQQTAVATLGDRRQQLLQELASAQNISVQLATQRQQGLEQRRQQRLAQQRRQELLQQQRQLARQQRQQHRADLQAKRREQPATPHVQPAPQPQTRPQPVARPKPAPAPALAPSPQPKPAPAPPPAPRPKPKPAPAPPPPAPAPPPAPSPPPASPPAPAPPPPAPAPPPAPSPPPAPPPPAPSPPPAPPPSSGSAAAAVAFAYAHIGDPYVWGAAGPNAWDCSGLTMGAWASAGVYLPHYAAAQYAATTPISASQLQPGDLVYWASNPADPNTIFHEGLYIGNGQMIHAPRTGEAVRIESIYDWEMPDFFSRP